MRLPTIRFKITTKEYSLLKPGLDMLANRLATAKLGSFPFQHPWDRIDPIRSNVHTNRAFDEDMAARILRVRSKLWDLTKTRKIRLDALEIAAALLALRLNDRLPSDSHEHEAIQLLAKKLEIHRKRSMRATVAKFGRDFFSAMAEIWRRFVAWCRYHLLYTCNRSALNYQNGHPNRKRLWADQRAQLADLICSAIEKHCYAGLNTSQMDRMVRLIKEEIRRGRHPYTLRELLADRQDEKLDLLFRLVSKKLELMPLAGAKIPPYVLALERAERFRTRDKRFTKTDPMPPNPAPSQMVVVDQSAALSTARWERSTFEGWELSEAVAEWFEKSVERQHWSEVLRLALNDTAHNLPSRITIPKANNLAELVRQSRPQELNTPDLPGMASILYLASWLLTWLNGCHLDYPTVAWTLETGYRQAARRAARQLTTKVA